MFKDLIESVKFYQQDRIKLLKCRKSWQLIIIPTNYTNLAQLESIPECKRERMQKDQKNKNFVANLKIKMMNNMPRNDEQSWYLSEILVQTVLLFCVCKTYGFCDWFFSSNEGSDFRIRWELLSHVCSISCTNTLAFHVTIPGHFSR